MRLPILFVLGMVILAGCASQPPQPNVTPPPSQPPTCQQYCITQPHIQCEGEWKISGTYPNCVCNFECKTEPVNETPPSPPPSATPPKNQTNVTPPAPPPPPPNATNVTPPAPPPPEVKEINVTAKQWEFTPSSITVKKGQSIRLRITSQDVTHGFSLLDFGINEQLTPGGTVEIQFIPDKAGSFTFRCSVFCGSGHGGMKGTLVVTE